MYNNTPFRSTSKSLCVQGNEEKVLSMSSLVSKQIKKLVGVQSDSETIKNDS